MKKVKVNKVKYIFYGILLTLIIITIISIIMTYFNKYEVIYIKDYDAYDETINKIKTNIDKIKDNNCASSLNSLRMRIDDTHFTSNTTLNEYYNKYHKDNLTFLDYYNEVLNSCNIDNKDSIYVKVLDSLVFPTYIDNKYNLIHEINLKDYNTRRNLKNYDEIGSYTNKVNELEVLSLLTNEALNEKD